MHYIIKLYEVWLSFRNDQRAVVSIEYVIVAASITAIVALAFGAGGPLQTALTTGLGNIGTAITNATAPAA